MSAPYWPARIGTVLELGAVFAARAVAGLGGVAFSIVVARLTGADGLGQFTVAFTTVTVIAMLARVGLDSSLLRAVAGAIAREAASDLPALLWHCLRLAAAVSLSAAAGVWLISRFLPASWPAAALLSVLAWAAVPLTLLAVISAYLKARRLASAAALLESGGLTFVAGGLLWIMSLVGLSVGTGTVALVIGAVAGFAAVIAIAWSLRDAAARAGRPVSLSRLGDARRRDLHAGQFDFMLITAAGYLTHAGSFIIVAPFLEDDVLGLARAAERLSLLIGFAMLAVVPFIAPRIVHHATRRQPALLRRLIVRACGLSAALALPVALVLIVAPVPALSLFGDGFGDAAPLLIVFAVAQFFAAMTGPLPMILSMTGHERTARRIVVGTLALSAVVLPLAAATFGAMGFALVYTLARLAKGGMLVFATRAALAIVPHSSGLRDVGDCPP